MGEPVKMLFGLLGGLAVFLYAMQTMSQALERAAGDGLHRALERLTRTPLRGALVGAAATAAVQSSSAVTVTAVGFVSAGLMGLSQAVPVIFGANVGTTVTAQLLAFRLEDWLGPVTLAGLILYLSAREERPRQAALALFSFGLLFAGVDAMAAAMSPLADSARFAGLMALAAEKPLLGMVMGAALTAAIQSSSAAVAVLQAAAVQTGALDLAGAVPILLGTNIGTTVTALLAAAGRSRDARRAALAHFLFNASGAAVCLALLPAFTGLVGRLSPANAGTSRLIANAHTLFNLLCTAIWLPLTPLMTRLATGLIPERSGPSVRLRRSSGRPRASEAAPAHTPPGASRRWD